MAFGPSRSPSGQVNLGMISLNETEVTKKLAGWAAIVVVILIDIWLYLRFRKAKWL